MELRRGSALSLPRPARAPSLPPELALRPYDALGRGGAGRGIRYLGLVGMPLSHLIGWQMTAAPHLETAGAGAGGGLGAAGDDPQKLAALYRLTDRLFRAETEQDVYEAGLDAMGEAMGCERASILRFDEQKTMRFVAWRGLSASYRAAVDGHTPWRAGQRVSGVSADETD